MVETVTAHYGWTKPEVTKSASTWGGFLNTDLDSIDAQLWSINTQVNANTITIARGPDGGAYGQVLFQNNGGAQTRWRLGETSETESGSNAGTNFFLEAWNDSGIYLGKVFEVIRATRNVTFSQSMTVGGGVTVSGALGCNSLSVTTGISVPSITSPTVNATTVSASTSVTSPTVNATTSITSPTVSATTVNATGLITGNNLTASNGFVNIKKGTAPNATLFLNDNTQNRSAFFFDTASNQTIVGDLVSGGQLTLDGVANFHFNGTANAYKAGGGSWISPSDARIKTVTGEYTSGLNEVLQLNPVTYVYKGNEARTARTAGQSFVGLIADDVLPVMPEMVSLSDAVINGVAVNDLKSLDTTPLIFALVNAVRELKAEIEALKAR